MKKLKRIVERQKIPCEELQAVSLEEYVKTFRELPDLVMTHGHGLYLDGCDDDEKRFVAHIRKEYRHTALWLEFYFLKRTQFYFEACLKPQIYYKPFAELQMAYLKLAEEIYLRSPEAQINYPSPLSWLFLIQIEYCDQKLRDSGFLDNPKIRGKRELYDEAKNLCRKLENTGRYNVKHIKNTQVSCSPGRHLRLEAMNISQLDMEFRHHYWQDFLKSEKRFYRLIRDCPLKAVFMWEGKLTIKGNGDRGKDINKRKTKGFT